MLLTESKCIHLSVYPGIHPGRLMVGFHTSDVFPYKAVRYTHLWENKPSFRLTAADGMIFRTTCEILMPTPTSRQRNYVFPYTVWGGTPLQVQVRFLRVRVLFHPDVDYPIDSDHQWSVYAAPGLSSPTATDISSQVHIDVPGGGRYYWTRVNGRMPTP